MYRFISRDTFDMPKKGVVYFVDCPKDCIEFSWLIGQEVTINGKAYKVKNVERKMRAFIRKGEKIGLLV